MFVSCPFWRFNGSTIAGEGIKENNDNTSLVIVWSLFAALGVLSKYLFIYLLSWYRHIFYLFNNKKKNLILNV